MAPLISMAVVPPMARVGSIAARWVRPKDRRQIDARRLTRDRQRLFQLGLGGKPAREATHACLTDSGYGDIACHPGPSRCSLCQRRADAEGYDGRQHREEANALPVLPRLVSALAHTQTSLSLLPKAPKPMQSRSARRRLRDEELAARPRSSTWGRVSVAAHAHRRAPRGPRPRR